MFIKRIVISLSLLVYCTFSYAQYSNYEFSTLRFVANGESSYASPSDVANAQIELGWRYYNGTGGASKDYSKAFQWFLKPANYGNRWAQAMVGIMYENGDGVEQDISKALYWHEKAANQHYHESSLRAGKMYYFGRGAAQNYQRASYYFKDAAFGGIAEGMYFSAWCNAYGQGVPADSTKAYFWANRAIDEGYDEAYTLLGNMYLNGLSVKKNPKKAKSYYEKGIERNRWSSINSMGLALENGEFGEVDYVGASEYYIKAAEQGYSYSIENLARLYTYKKYEMVDYDKAAFWYQKLVDMGYGKEYYKVLTALYNEKKDYASAAKILIKRAEADDLSAINSLAYCYADGKGVEKDFNKAIEWIDYAISKAPSDATYLDSKGEILLKKGDIKGAKKIWKKINTQFPLFYQEYLKEYEEPPFYTYMKSQEK